ncbi:hypothetical protein AB1K84_03735 [Mesobacillus foraminis]|uniref:hypothetical protein n=1 Tax=Mesobacillus foraminis TaxID=279826 RepID=UPI00399F36A2
MKNKSVRSVTTVLCALVLLNSIPFPSAISVYAGTNSVHTLKFSNNIKVKTLFYPYRDPANIKGTAAKGLQGITADPKNNFYLTYGTADKTTYGYIYKYSSKGKLLKKSKKLTIGHGQAISYMDGFLYQIADIKGQKSYMLQKINPETLTVVKKWRIPSAIHPNVLAMQDANTAIAVSKAGDGYDINKIHLGKGPEATRDWREKIHVKGLIGKTPKKEIQGFAIGGHSYYLLSNGEYMTFDRNGKNIKRVSLNTAREPEGIAILKNGKLVIAFNKLNEIFIQQ